MAVAENGGSIVGPFNKRSILVKNSAPRHRRSLSANFAPLHGQNNQYQGWICLILEHLFAFFRDLWSWWSFSPVSVLS